MKNWFKPLSKRNALYAAIVIGVILIYGLFGFVKDIIAGLTFDEMRSSILIIIFAGILEYAMVTIALSKDDPEDDAEKTESLPDGKDQ